MVETLKTELVNRGGMLVNSEPTVESPFLTELEKKYFCN